MSWEPTWTTWQRPVSRKEKGNSIESKECGSVVKHLGSECEAHSGSQYHNR